MGGEQPYGFKVEGRPQQPNYQGRFPANLLVSDNVLNDGRNSRSAGIDNRGEAKTGGYGGELGKGKIDVQQYHDSGSFSRFFDLDTCSSNGETAETHVLPDYSWLKTR